MDHIFEQKLVKENQQLQLELIKLNKQIKQLQETVVQYDGLFNNLMEATPERLGQLGAAAHKRIRQMHTLGGMNIHNPTDVARYTQAVRATHTAVGQTPPTGVPTVISRGLDIAKRREEQRRLSSANVARTGIMQEGTKAKLDRLN